MTPLRLSIPHRATACGGAPASEQAAERWGGWMGGLRHAFWCLVLPPKNAQAKKIPQSPVKPMVPAPQNLCAQKCTKRTKQEKKRR